MKNKPNASQILSVDVSGVKTRTTWGSVKPYTRIEHSKKAYRREGKGRTCRDRY